MDNKLRKIQLAELNILKFFDSFCKKHNLHYSLYAGTLIGAVRHKGFIPWDDDIDICMTRSEYEKFIRIWNNSKINDYILQNKENTPGFTQSFSKIRKKHTLFLQEVDMPDLYHTGIFIDIFPIDRIPSSYLGRNIYRFECILYQLCTKEYVPKYSNALIKNCSAIFLFFVKGKTRTIMRKKLQHSILKYNNNSKYDLVGTETMNSIMASLPCDIMDEYIELEFEGEMFMSVKQYDLWLRKLYGDYMTLPPENERVGLHSLIAVDFDHDYEEYCRLKSLN